MEYTAPKWVKLSRILKSTDMEPSFIVAMKHRKHMENDIIV